MRIQSPPIRLSEGSCQHPGQRDGGADWEGRPCLKSGGTGGAQAGDGGGLVAEDAGGRDEVAGFRWCYNLINPKLSEPPGLAPLFQGYFPRIVQGNTDNKINAKTAAGLFFWHQAPA